MTWRSCTRSSRRLERRAVRPLSLSLTATPLYPYRPHRIAQAYHVKLTTLVWGNVIDASVPSVPSDAERDSLKNAAEAFGLSREQVRG